METSNNQRKNRDFSIRNDEHGPFPRITRSDSVRLEQQGQVRTLADIAMTLNSQNHYSDIETFMRDFNDTIRSYSERGTVSPVLVQTLGELIQDNESNLFSNDGYLDLDRFIEMVDDLSTSDANNPLEAIYSRREKTKMFQLAVLLNDIVHYTNANELASDLKMVASGGSGCGDSHVMDDTFHYPLFFFRHGLELVWNEIQDKGYMSNELLEQKMFTEHEERVKTYGLDYVTKNDYYQDGPCHPEVYFPKRIGTAPVYFLDSYYLDHCTKQPKLSKSCGEGKGPRAHRTLYEMHLVKDIIYREMNKGRYENLGSYYIPVDDDSKPVFVEGHGIMEFDVPADKLRFLQRIRHTRGQC